MSLPRYRRPPMRQQGAITERKRPARGLARNEVVRRCKDTCEACGRQGALEGHHAFRRGTVAGIPASVCETPELIVGLCRDDPSMGREGCHDRIHRGDTRLMDDVRWMAIGRFATRHGLNWIGLPGDPIDAMRDLVRQVEQREEATG